MPKPSPIYVSDVTTISPLIQLLEQIVEQQYELKALTNNHVKIQPKNSDSYQTIVKVLAEKQAEFHTYKSKEERNYRVVLKNMQYSINPEDIKMGTEKLGHSIRNIWNIKQYRTELPLFMFFVELQPAPNNKDIFNVKYIQQCKIKFEPPRYKRDIAQCANYQRYGHTKNYCHLKPRRIKCTGNHLTNLWHPEEKLGDTRCVLCSGNHSANYDGCMVYKKLQKKMHPSLLPKKIHPPTQIKHTLYTQPGVTYAQVTQQNFYVPTNTE
jgi:hypothetical protein